MRKVAIEQRAVERVTDRILARITDGLSRETAAEGRVRRER